MAEGDEDKETTQENIQLRISKPVKRAGFFGQKGRWALNDSLKIDGRGKDEDWGGHGTGLRKSKKPQIRGGASALNVELKKIVKRDQIVEEDEKLLN